MVKKTHSWLSKIDVFQVVAVVLVAAVAVFFGAQWAGHNLEAASLSNATLTVTLTSDQPDSLSQLAENQKVAQFQFATDSSSPVTITALKFNLLGGIKNKVYRQLNIVPLSLVYQAETISAGASWLNDYGLIEQIMTLSKPLTVIAGQPVAVDVYADLTRQRNQAFGLDLVGVESPLLANGIPVQTTIYKIGW